MAEYKKIIKWNKKPDNFGLTIGIIMFGFTTISIIEIWNYPLILTKFYTFLLIISSIFIISMSIGNKKYTRYIKIRTRHNYQKENGHKIC